MDDASARPRATPALSFAEISLVNFRSYAAAKLTLERGPVVLAGPNGTGKTNCLEAISLLSPGRGLRGAKIASLQRKVPLSTSPERGGPLSQSPWTVAATIARPVPMTSRIADVAPIRRNAAISATQRRGMT